ncbi:MAG TPA: zinc resistance protein [Desulfobulbaceae bacterium]|nr:zinc resistance protein [Desulfobulbaceae bacterium]
MKTLIGVAVIGMVLTAVSAFAVGYGPGSCGMRGWGGGYSANVSDADHKKFMDETAALRKTIAVDRAELNALMAGKDPDAKRVRELTASIVDTQEKVAEIARASNISAPGAGGFGCNGPRRLGKGYRGGFGPGNGPGYGPGPQL